MEQDKRELWAHVLNEARAEAKPVAQLTQQIDLSRAEAYAIQERQFELREGLGEKLIGWKMGLTSEAKRRQMNLDSPLYGFLTNKMQVQSGSVFSMSGRIHPKIEPEIAFLIKNDLSGKVTREQVIKSCKAVCAALEILDSRYTQFKYFSMEDVIADNSSSSDFILGEWVEDFERLDLRELKMEMYANGSLVEAGISKDISGDPVLSVVQLCELLSDRSQTLKAGSIVLAGAATAAIPLSAGLKVDLKVDGLKAVSINVRS